MPTHHDETLPQRYEREHQAYLKLCGSMTAEQVADLQWQLNNSLAREQALQQRLTAADEALDKAADEFILMSLEAGQRLDVLEGLLRNASAWIKRNSCHGTDAIELWERIDAALKPAECNDSCEFCKGWGFLANQDGADEGCGACNGTGKEPSDEQ